MNKKIMALLSVACLLAVFLSGPFWMPRIWKAYLYSFNPTQRARHIKHAHAIDYANMTCSETPDEAGAVCWQRAYDGFISGRIAGD